MKKSVWVILAVSFLVILALIANYVDTGRVTTGQEPKYCLKTVNREGNQVTYWGLGYKVIRYVGVSPNEPYQDNKGVKMGSWFMKYDLPKTKTVYIEYQGITKEITDYDKVSTLENILINSKYDFPECDGISTHKIILDDEIYQIKESCKEIQKGEKQAKLSDEDLNVLLQIIESDESQKNSEEQ